MHPKNNVKESPEINLKQHLKTVNKIQAFIGLGSNLNKPEQQIRAGIDALTQIAGVEDVTSAPWYRSQAIGPGEQPDYINTVVKLTTTLEPHSLLQCLQSIENVQGRQRKIRWGARTLDLDLLLYNQQQICTDDLVVPHPEMQNRAFVLLPLYDLEPSLILPGGERLTDLVKQCDKIGLQKIEDIKNYTLID
jgi:2-amino-4-hydroxy-6-hydroxymethyldihydropteridine diphosphokinase